MARCLIVPCLAAAGLVSAASNLSDAAAAALAYDRANYVNGVVTEDPFYTVLPPDAASAAPGTMLKVEKQTNATLFALPPTSSLSRFIYQSKTLNGSLVPVSAYVLWPYTPRKQKDGFAVVVWAHGSSGLTSNCAPSHIRNLWQHFLAPFLLSMQGYVVVATDYAGLGVPFDAKNNSIIHEYMASPSLANDVLYSVQAAQSAFPELSKDFVVFGHSLGGGAAWAVAQKQVNESTPGYLGAIAGSPTTAVLNETGIAGTAIAALIAPGVASAISGFKTTDITTPASQAALDQMFEYGGCMAMVDAGLLSAATSGAALAQDGWQQNPHIQEWQALTVSGGREIAGPLLVFHGENDPILTFNLTVAAVEDTILKFPNSQIEFIALPNVTHVPSLQAAQPLWMDWIAARFAGEPISNSSVLSTAEPAKPLEAQETAFNYYIGLATEFYQIP